MKKRTYLVILLLIGVIFFIAYNSLNNSKKEILTIYTHRHYDIDKELFKQFFRKHQVKINVVNAKADELILKLKNEGANSPADILITVDAGRLALAKNQNLLQSIKSSKLDKVVPPHLRDSQGYWYAISKRARVIAYDIAKINANQLSTYEDLTNSKWRGELLVRSSDNIYNQSLMASIIANVGREEAKKWAAGIVDNFARAPKGNDRDQISSISKGDGTLAIVNTYYMGKLLYSKNPSSVEAAQKVKLFFPNQNGRGTHINISGIGVTKYSQNKQLAILLIEFLLKKENQELFASANYEYPVNPEAEISKLLQSWGSFKEDQLSLEKLGELNREAVILFDEVSWP